MKIPYALILVFALIVVFITWSEHLPPPAPIFTRAASVPAQPAQLKGEPKKTIPAKVQVYQDKPRAMKKAGLDPAVDSAPAEAFQSAADLPATPAGATAAVFLNASTGSTRIVFKPKPRPLFSFERGLELGLRYGVSTRGMQAATLFVRQDIARIGNVYLSGYGELSSDIGPDPRPEAKAMIEISGRFHNIPGLE